MSRFIKLNLLQSLQMYLMIVKLKIVDIILI